MKIFKVVCLIIISFIITNVNAKDVQIYFITEGGSTNTQGFKVVDDYVNKTDGTYCATYNSNGKINSLNSINGTSFSIYKNDTSLVSGREWYTYNYSNNKLYYFSQNNSYNVSEVLQKLDLSNDTYPIISLFAHWEGDGVDEGTDIEGTSNKGSTSNTASLKSISVSGSSKINKGKSTTLKVTYKPSNAKKETITWSSSNNKIATVTSSGKVTGVSKGNVTITAKTISGKKTTFKITVVDKNTNKVNISFNMNGGSLSSHTASLSSSGGYIVRVGNNSKIINIIYYGSKTDASGLPNYNNSNYLSIIRNGYIAKKGAEWNTKPDGSGKSYNQDKVYKASDFCDAKKKDCSVTLYVNWVKTNKNKLKSLGVITPTDLVLKVPNVTLSDSTVLNISQGFTKAGDYYLFCLKNKSDTITALSLYKNDTLVKKKVFYKKLGHCNDLTYNMKEKKIYISASKTLDGYSKSISLSSSVKGDFKLSSTRFKGNSGIAFDVSNGYYYFAGGNKVWVSSKDNKIIKSFNKIQKDYPQGIGAYKGKILVIRFNNKADKSSTIITNNRNSIDIYRAKTGEYLGSYIIKSSAELEAVDWDGQGNNFLLFFSGGLLYKVSMNIPN